MRWIRILLVIIAVVCIGVALSYPIRYRLAQNENNSNMDELAAMRARVQDTDDAPGDGPVGTDGGDVSGEEEDVAPGVPQRPDRPAEAEEGSGDTGTEEDVAPGVPQRPDRPSEAEEGSGEASAPVTRNETGAGDPAEAADAEKTTITGEAESPEGAVDVGQGPAAGDATVPQDGEATAEATSEITPEPTPVAEPDLALLYLDDVPLKGKALSGIFAAEATPTPEPEPTPVWDDYEGPLPYPMLDKVEFDQGALLPELREIYALNHDLVGWINIPGTVIDYPVVQCQDSDYYLEHDFYGKENINGQIILDTLCDPYTPSYNLIISGHHMKNGSMFGDLPEYRTQAYWEKHKLVEFDSLMFRKQYVVFAAFYSADYDEDEEGFRYNANIQYKMEAQQWLKEIEENQLYDTGIDVQFGDEFITLTTCNRARHRNGRFVVVCRRIREGETFE